MHDLLSAHDLAPSAVLLVSMAQTLEEILAELRRANSIERTGAVSSVEVKYSAATKDRPSEPMPVVKSYAGSEPPVEEAIEAFGRALLGMPTSLDLGAWQATVALLEAKREATA
jgi:hypothetical protein